MKKRIISIAAAVIVLAATFFLLQRLLMPKYISVNEEGDHATATVKYYYVDASPILQDVLGEYLGQAFASAFSGISEDDLRAMAEQILNDKMETAQTGSAQMSVTYDLVKSGKEWKITEVPKDSLQVLTANFVKSITDLASVFGKTG